MPAPWNEICPNKYTFRLHTCCSIMAKFLEREARYSTGDLQFQHEVYQKLHQRTVRGAFFYVYLCGDLWEIPWRHLVPQIRFANCWT